MVHSDVHKNGYFKSCSTMMEHSARPCGLGFGIMLVLIGAIWLAAEMGWIIPDLFWPTVVLAAGIAVLALNLARTNKSRVNEKRNKEV